jgi:archaellum component FlaF (FlaF/FlaG flagellin family)
MLSQGGKGRTGTVIICYLYFSQIRPFESIQAARTLFAQKRSKIEKGIIQPSQIRYNHQILCSIHTRLNAASSLFARLIDNRNLYRSYVDYFADILEGTADCESRALTIDQIQMRRMPDKVKSGGELLHIEIYDYTSTASVLPNDAPLWTSYDEANEE